MLKLKRSLSLNFNFITSAMAKLRTQVACPRYRVGSWQEPLSLRANADLSTIQSHPPTCPAVSVGYGGSDTSDSDVISWPCVWAFLKTHDSDSHCLAALPAGRMSAGT